MSSYLHNTLMMQENLYRQLLDQLKTGVLLLDSGLHLTYLNLAAESLLEVSGNQATKMRLGELLCNNPEDIKEIEHAVQVLRSYTKHQVKFRLLNGNSITVDYTVNPYQESGQTQVLLEVHSLYYSQRISRDEALLSTQATTRELVRGLAHEIKNPLGGIRGAAQLLSKELDSDELRDYTAVIIEEADRLHNLVDRLIGSRKIPDMKLLNIHEVLERVTSLVEAELGGKSIKVCKDYDPSIPLIKGDAEQLIQATLNIVRNAVQAIERNADQSCPGEICLRTRVIRNTTVGNTLHRLAVRVSVQDNGPGIPDGISETLFFPMISGRADGTGLGLSIAQSIINQHGGIIECDSHPGSTKFMITVPI